MSRCFPYPPPGYTLSGDRKEALIESIKLQKDKVKSEEQRKKERKREKKEKRKEKKLKTTHQNHEKEKSRENSKVVQCPIDEKSWAPTDVKSQSLLHKVSKAEADQLERSSLTEERGKPVLLPSTSSDSTENSNKRKRQSSPLRLDLDCPRAQGKIIRIKLSSKKPNQPIDASVNEQKTCSTSGRTDFSSFNKDDVVFRQRTEDLSSCTLIDPALGTVRDQKVLISAQKMSVPLVTTPVQRSALLEKSNGDKQALVTAARDQTSLSSQQTEPDQKTQAPPLTRMQKSALRYKNLTEMWVPPQLEFVLANETDEDWLFRGKKDAGISSEKRCISGNDGMSCSSSLSLWPRAQYLQEVDLYALPYTVPY